VNLTEHQDVDFPDLGMNEHTWACIRRIYGVLHVDATDIYVQYIQIYAVLYQKCAGVK